MTLTFSLLHTPNFTNQFHSCHSEVFPSQAQPANLSSRKSCTGFGSLVRFRRGSLRCDRSARGLVSSGVECRVDILEKSCDTTKSDAFLYVQTLREFPTEKLYGEVVIVRFDSDLLLDQLSIDSVSVNKALSTIKYLYDVGAKVLLVSNWDQSSDSTHLSADSFADYLSSLLCLKVLPANGISGPIQSKTKDLENADVLLLENLTNFREELANCSDFSGKLSSGAYIFVNDAFCLSHKILASTVGITRFCYASVAGFHFEEELLHLKDVRKTNRRPYVAIIGGSKFLEKASALHHLASVCDGLIFVGMMGFQIMHASGLSVPSYFLEKGAAEEAVKLILLAQRRSIPIYFPDDFWCINDCNRTSLELFPSDGIMTGWTPVDFGPMSMKEIFSMLSKCKKVLWIGPVKFSPLIQHMNGASELALVLESISQTGCDVTVVGSVACKGFAETASPLSPYKILKSASVVWEFLKGKTLPGVAALDRAYPFDLDWNTIFPESTQPLVVDIGSGNGLFLLQMAKRWKKLNFLGLEINDKLVRRCLDNIAESDIRNGYFISTNATSTFRSIISSYPGDLILVSIQVPKTLLVIDLALVPCTYVHFEYKQQYERSCPDPDFNKEVHRWKMVQSVLMEAIIDLLKANGQVFLQSDIESVATRMKEQFVLYGRGRLVIDGGDENGWIPENPFGVHSDWEQHVLDRGAPMYRVLLRKVGELESRV